MSAPAPDDITDDREKWLWNIIARTYEEFCGPGNYKHLWPQRTERFQYILKRVDETLEQNKKK